MNSKVCNLTLSSFRFQVIYKLFFLKSIKHAKFFTACKLSDNVYNVKIRKFIFSSVDLPTATMKVLSAFLDSNIFYFSILFLSCLFLFSVLDIYVNKKKNLWHLKGPFPLPLVGKVIFLLLFLIILNPRKCSTAC